MTSRRATARLVRLLAEHVLHAQDIRDGEVTMVSLQLFGQRGPPDDRSPVDVRHLGELVREGSRLSQSARQFRA